MKLKLKNMISVMFCCLICLSAAQTVHCQASTPSISEQYSSCFNEEITDGIIIKKTNKEDVKILKSMLIDSGRETIHNLVVGGEFINTDVLFAESDEIFSLTIKNSQNSIVGQIQVSKTADENTLNIGYWIGKDFRGRGYASLAVEKVISKIWEINDKIYFQFFIDDRNIASIKTMEKVCTKLGVDFKDPKSSRFIKENLSHKFNIYTSVPDCKILYIYYNGHLIDIFPAVKENLLKLYSEDELKNGLLAEYNLTKYIVKNQSQNN